MTTPALVRILDAITEYDLAIAIVDGELCVAGPCPDKLGRDITAYRQDLAVHYMTLRGDYDGEPCAHELRVLKALQGCVVQDIEQLVGVPNARFAVERARQALADIGRMASVYRWLSNPENATEPTYYDRVKWIGHAALRLVSAGTELETLLRPSVKQAVLL